MGKLCLLVILSTLVIIMWMVCVHGEAMQSGEEMWPDTWCQPMHDNDRSNRAGQFRRDNWYYCILDRQKEGNCTKVCALRKSGILKQQPPTTKPPKNYSDPKNFPDHKNYQDPLVFENGKWRKRDKEPKKDKEPKEPKENPIWMFNPEAAIRFLKSYNGYDGIPGGIGKKDVQALNGVRGEMLKCDEKFNSTIPKLNVMAGCDQGWTEFLQCVDTAYRYKCPAVIKGAPDPNAGGHFAFQ